MNNIASHFFTAAKKFPNKVAFRSQSKEYHYGELAKMVARKAVHLEELGIKKGQPIFIAMPVSIELYTTLLAAFSVGATAVLLDDPKQKQKLRHALQTTNCQMILTTPKLWWLRFFFLPFTYWFKCKVVKGKGYENFSPRQVEQEDSALITFTSGTTGKPKAANRTHGFLQVQLQTLVEEMQINEQSIHLSSLPVVLLCNLATGAETVFANQSRPCSIISGSPYHVDQFLKERKDHKDLRIFVGGSTIYTAFAKKMEANFPNAQIQFAYGSTEVEPISLISCEQYLTQYGDIGVPVGRVHPNIDVKLDMFHKQKEIIIGEILVRGSHVLKSYVMEANTKTKWVNGWLKTGDLGFFRGENLFFLGRKKYCWVKDEKVQSPLDVEQFTGEIYPSATQLLVNEKAILFYKKTINQDLLQKIRSSYSFDQEVEVIEFLYDKRHNSRIDYEQLIKQIT